MEPTINTPYRKSDYYDEKGNLLKNSPFPYINEGGNRKSRRTSENPDKGRGWLYVLKTGKYKIRIQVIRDIINSRVRQTWNSQRDNKPNRFRTFTLYGKIINIIRHSDVKGNISK